MVLGYSVDTVTDRLTPSDTTTTEKVTETVTRQSDVRLSIVEPFYRMVVRTVRRPDVPRRGGTTVTVPLPDLKTKTSTGERVETVVVDVLPLVDGRVPITVGKQCRHTVQGGTRVTGPETPVDTDDIGVDGVSRLGVVAQEEITVVLAVRVPVRVEVTEGDVPWVKKETVKTEGVPRGVVTQVSFLRRPRQSGVVEDTVGEGDTVEMVFESVSKEVRRLVHTDDTLRSGLNILSLK